MIGVHRLMKFPGTSPKTGLRRWTAPVVGSVATHGVLLFFIINTHVKTAAVEPDHIIVSRANYSAPVAPNSKRLDSELQTQANLPLEHGDFTTGDQQGAAGSSVQEATPLPGTVTEMEAGSAAQADEQEIETAAEEALNEDPAEFQQPPVVVKSSDDYWKKYIEVPDENLDKISRNSGYISAANAQLGQAIAPQAKTIVNKLPANKFIEVPASSSFVSESQANPKPRIDKKLQPAPNEADGPVQKGVHPKEVVVRDDSNEASEDPQPPHERSAAAHAHRRPAPFHSWWQPSVQRTRSISPETLDEGYAKAAADTAIPAPLQAKHPKRLKVKELKKAISLKVLHRTAPCAGCEPDKDAPIRSPELYQMESMDELRASLGITQQDSQSNTSDNSTAGVTESYFTVERLVAENSYIALGTANGEYRKLLDEIISSNWMQADLTPGARAQGVQGATVIDFTVKRSGKVKHLNVLRPSGHAQLDAMAVAAIPKRLPRIPAFLKERKVRHRYIFQYINPAVLR